MTANKSRKKEARDIVYRTGWTYMFSLFLCERLGYERVSLRDRPGRRGEQARPRPASEPGSEGRPRPDGRCLVTRCVEGGSIVVSATYSPEDNKLRLRASGRLSKELSPNERD